MPGEMDVFCKRFAAVTLMFSLQLERFVLLRLIVVGNIVMHGVYSTKYTIK
jgi:hypothetical protein